MSIFHKRTKSKEKVLGHVAAALVSQHYTNQNDPLDNSFYESHSMIGEDDISIKREQKKSKKKQKNKAPSRHNSDAKDKGTEKVRSKLKKFINRRPTYDSLLEKGIIKVSVFGCALDTLCHKESTTVPNFIKMCVTEVEKRGLNTDGIYRVSGNLSHVQRLRYLVDRDEPVDLSEEQWEDIHLITGALKLFLRELPEPVIPFNFFDKFITACKTKNDNDRLKMMKGLVGVLPAVNKDTLKYLMSHFRKVVEHSEKNRMQVQNIAIVFGPTLLLKPPTQGGRPDSTGGHMAVYMVYQNQIIDYMLTEFNHIFR